MRTLLARFCPDGQKVLLAAVACGLGGCAQSDRGEPGSPRAMWKVEMEPSVSVGAVGQSASVASDQITTAVRLSDGRIVVAHGGLSSRLTVLTPDGDFSTTIGRSGEGLGEYQWITSLQAGADDSLYVFDAAQQRLTAFSSDGLLGRTAKFSAPGAGTLRSVTRLTDSVWLARGLDRPLRGTVDQIMRDTIPFGLVDASLSRIQVLTRLPTSMSITFAVHGRVAFGSALFSPRALHATWGRCVFVSTAEEPSIKVYSAGGAQVSDIRVLATRRPVDPEDVSTFVQARLEQGSTAVDTAVAEALGRTADPEYLPYFNQMVVDQWGNIWLEEYSPPFGSGGRWHVVAQSGQAMGPAVLPPRLSVYEISAGGVLGVTVGGFGEPIVVVLPLTSGPTERSSVIPECRSAQ